MKYLILSDDIDLYEFELILIKEIRRFDIRAQVFVIRDGEIVKQVDETINPNSRNSLTGKSSIIKNHQFDLIVNIGQDFNRKLNICANSLGTKSCYYKISKEYIKSDSLIRLAQNPLNKIFADLPIYNQNQQISCIGHFTTDLIRTHDFNIPDSDELTLGILLGNSKNVKPCMSLMSKVSERINDCKWLINSEFLSDKIKTQLKSTSTVEVVDSKLDLLKAANAVVLDSEQDAIVAALMNCPQVSIAGEKGFFGFSSTKSPLINNTLDNKLVKNFSPNHYEKLSDELLRIVNDHEYCATMMSGYQLFKDKIGSESVARNLARTMIEWLEESEN